MTHLRHGLSVDLCPFEQPVVPVGAVRVTPLRTAILPLFLLWLPGFLISIVLMDLPGKLATGYLLLVYDIRPLRRRVSGDIHQTPAPRC